jgi:putative glutamine amidotransferase
LKWIATWIRECDEKYFSDVFEPYPEVLLSNARTGVVPWDSVEGLLLTGGADISESFLRQPVPNPALILDADLARDSWEFESLEKALKWRLPIFVICRGLQILNVALGGTLHLDIPNHDNARTENIQELSYSPGVPIQFPRVNSSHHQALAQPGAGVIVEARCRVDGVIEQVRVAEYPFALGVQYHPERDPLYRPLFDAFVGQVTGGDSCH